MKYSYVDTPIGAILIAGDGTFHHRNLRAANGANPIPIITPCYRVIGANGSLTGFGGGLDIKRQLLTLEARVA